MRIKQSTLIQETHGGEHVLVMPTGSSCESASVSTTTPHSSSPLGWRFTSRQPISSGASSSAGRAKKDWGSAERVLVAMGVASAMLKWNTFALGVKGCKYLEN